MEPLLRRLPVLVATLLVACGSPEPQPYALDETGSSRHLLTCATVIGKVRTPVTYTVTRPANPVAEGGIVPYEIVAPLAQIDTPVSATFVSSDVTFAIPEGLELLTALAHPTSSADFSAAWAEVSEREVTLRLTGSFPLDEKTRPVPVLKVTAKVTAAPGTTVTWRTPERVVATARVDLFGDQVTRCEFDEPGAIAVTDVE